jgi:hypothetical protein
MAIRRFLAVALAAAIAVTPAASVAQQATGLIAGKASDEVKPPYADYAVVLRNVATSQPVANRPLDNEGRFSFPNLPLNQRYLVELVHTKQNKVICTEGPYGLVVGDVTSKTDVNIDCGKPPALLWILGAGAAAALIGATQASPSR